MIFDRDDLACVGRLLLRRSVDFAAAALRPDRDDVHQRMWLDFLARQIEGLQALAAIGEDRAEDLRGLLEAVRCGLVAPPPWMADGYLSGISERDARDEAALLLMVRIVGERTPLLAAAVALADEGPSGDLGLRDSDVRLCSAVRGILSRLSERADGQDPEVLGDSMEYIGAADALCSAVVAVHSGHPVPSRRLSAVLDALDRVGSDDFDALFLDVLDDGGRAAMRDFSESTGRYVVGLAARIVLNARYPLSAGMAACGRSRRAPCPTLPPVRRDGGDAVWMTRQFCPAPGQKSTPIYIILEDTSNMDEVEIARTLTRSDIEVLPDNGYLCNRNKELFKAIRDMKQQKIRAFQEASAAGRVPKDASDDIVGVLNTDAAVCDALIGTDFDDEESIARAAELIKGIIRSSPAPGHQAEYTATLTQNEASMEILFCRIVLELQKKLRG